MEASIPGVYVIHTGEEIGCIGSQAIVKDRPQWFDYVQFAISFDRKGYSSVVTYQMGHRTCSDNFADSFIEMRKLKTVVVSEKSEIPSEK